MSSTSLIDELCERFAYPQEVRSALLDLIEALRPVPHRAVLLLGSAARGELSYRRNAHGGLEMFSDLEVFCVGERPPARTRAHVQQRFRLIEQRFAPTPFFHVDCLFAPAFPQGDESRGLLWFEGGSTFRPIEGGAPDVFGDVLATRVSLGVVHELVSIRLWWTAVYLPLALLRDPAARLAEPRRETLQYSLLRNLLDVASILLMHERRFVSGYRDRADALSRNWQQSKAQSYFDPSFPHCIAEATQRKLSCELEGDPRLWYRRLVSDYERLTALLLELPPGCGPPSLVSAVSDQWGRLTTFPRTRRFRIFEKTLRVRWALRSRRPLPWLRERETSAAAVLRFLLEMHRAALHRLEGDDATAWGWLAAGCDTLYRFAGVRVPLPAASGDFADTWSLLLERFTTPMTAYYRKLGSHADGALHRLRTQREELS